MFRRLFFALCSFAIALAQSRPASSGDVATFSSKVNLVLVPVVVRDSHGRPVGQLTKDSFQLFDRGKRQEISTFSAVERPAGPIVRSSAKRATGSTRSESDSPATAEPSPSAVKSETSQQRNLIYLFDDVNVRFSDLAQAREAAVQHFGKDLRDGDRAAVYSFSGNPMLEFTSDHERLQAAVGKLRWRALVGRGGAQCPDVSYYMADLVITKHDGQALEALVAHTVACTKTRPEVALGIATAAANRELILGAQDTELGLRTIRRAIRRLSGMVGQRVIVLASPGFFAQTPEAIKATAEVLDLAARSNVIISSLSVRGIIVAEEEEENPTLAGTGRRPSRASSPGNLWLQFRREGARANGDVMKELAEGTGGIFFHNNNDLSVGFDRASAAPEFSYVLGFAPSDLREDGTFHRLKVQVTESKGLNIEARRGYFAVKYDPKDRKAVADVDDALFSRDEVSEIPVVLQTGFSKGNTGTAAKVQAVARIDVSSLHFRKAEDRESQSLRVVAALFDQDGGYLTGSSELVNLKLRDGRAEQDPAVTLRWEFEAGSGAYFVRLVVREAQGTSMSTLTRSVTIP